MKIWSRGFVRRLALTENSNINIQNTGKTMSTVKVELPHHAYEILIENGALSRAASAVSPFLNRKFVAIVADANVAEIYLQPLKEAFHAEGIQTADIVVPAGEATKSWPYLEEVVDGLLEAKVERDDVVIALGGGVIGDLVGFASAILRRGVRFVQMPTSLLAQVDSSVGGKTGINSRSGKNLIGAFHQPILVLTDHQTLKTLSHREFLSGYAEVAKYGLLGDAEFFSWLENHVQEILGLEEAAVTKIITHSCQMKAEIVIRDEKEHGDRAWLNLGHTFGHALEKVTGYSERLTHGEGVAIGSILAFRLAEKLGFCEAGLDRRVKAHFEAMGMKTEIADIEGAPLSADEILDAMYQDKKVTSGNLNFILPRRIGEVFVAKDIDPNVVRKVLQEALS